MGPKAMRNSYEKIYFDQAATSFPKPEAVIRDMTECLTKYCANAGRGGHQMALKTSLAVEQGRDKLAELFHVSDSLCFCFTKNTTEALNLALRGTLQKGDHVITTKSEHSSVIRPLNMLKKEGLITLTLAEAAPDGTVRPEEILKHIKENTRLIAVTHGNNVTGSLNDVHAIAEKAHQKGVLVLVDGAQAGGALDIDLTGLDFYAIAAHKGLLAPPGIGALYIAPGVKVRPLLAGGTGTDSDNLYQPEEMPVGFESGTQNAPAIVGMSAGIDTLLRLGPDAVHAYEMMLFKRLYEGLMNIPKVTVYGHGDKKRHVGVLSFNVGEVPSVEIASRLDRENIFVRAGFHCNYLTHMLLGTESNGAVRLSFNHSNSLHQCDRVLAVVNRLAKEMG